MEASGEGPGIHFLSADVSGVSTCAGPPRDAAAAKNASIPPTITPWAGSNNPADTEVEQITAVWGLGPHQPTHEPLGLTRQPTPTSTRINGNRDGQPVVSTQPGAH